MNYRILASGFIVTFALLSCQAMGQYPRYVPPGGPTLPNALNYFRRDVGVLDPYNTFVNPNRQLRQQFDTMAQQQRSDYQRSQQEIGQVRSSLAAPTGINAGYMNHARYFNVPRGQNAQGRR